MMKLNAKTESLLYILLVLGGALAVVRLRWYQLMMFLPTLVALLMMLVIGRDGYSRTGWRRLGLHRSGVRAWPVAILLPAGALGSGYLVAAAAGVAVYTPLEGFTRVGLMLRYVLLVLIYTLSFSLGEEIGWRGYLLPRLMAFGRRKGYLIGGLAWACFHYPAMFFTDLYLPDGNRLLNAVVFTLMVLALNVVLGELRLASGSVWTASLLHSAHNAFVETVGIGFRVSAPAGHYLVGETSVVTLAFYGLAAVWLLARSRTGTAPAAG